MKAQHIAGIFVLLILLPIPLFAAPKAGRYTGTLTIERMIFLYATNRFNESNNNSARVKQTYLASARISQTGDIAIVVASDTLLSTSPGHDNAFVGKIFASNGIFGITLNDTSYPQVTINGNNLTFYNYFNDESFQTSSPLIDVTSHVLGTFRLHWRGAN